MNEIIVGLAFVALIAISGMTVYTRGRKYEETIRLEDVTAQPEDDLGWSLKYTSVAYRVQNDATADFEAGIP